MKLLQRVLLVVGVLALIVLVVEIAISIAATMRGGTPARVVEVDAGPYPLKVSLYKDPADAGYALPFSIAPQNPQSAPLTFKVTAIPGGAFNATPVQSSLTPDSSQPGAVQGVAEITVQGSWQLHIEVDGPQGSSAVDVPITANAPFALPEWAGWLIGCIPLYAFLLFFVAQRGQKKSDETPARTVPEEVTSLSR